MVVGSSPSMIAKLNILMMTKTREYFEAMNEELGHIFRSSVQTDIIGLPENTRICAINVSLNSCSIDLDIPTKLIIREINHIYVKGKLKSRIASFYEKYKSDVSFFNVGDRVKFYDQRKEDWFSYEIEQIKITHTNERYCDLSGDIGIDGTYVTIKEFPVDNLSRSKIQEVP